MAIHDSFSHHPLMLREAAPSPRAPRPGPGTIVTSWTRIVATGSCAVIARHIAQLTGIPNGSPSSYVPQLNPSLDNLIKGAQAFQMCSVAPPRSLLVHVSLWAPLMLTCSVWAG
jgi:hypothetical protein